MKNKLIKNRVFWLLLVTPLLVSCINKSISPSNRAPLGAEATEVIIANPQLTNTPLEAATITFTPESTARFFSEPDSCDPEKASGHILFLQRSRFDQSIDLYIMDGNACSKHLLMQDVSGAPAWSMDGKRISVGCGNNHICILDAPSSLDACLKSKDKYSDCKPVVLKKYELPSDGRYLINTSWSYDGTQLSVESGKESSYENSPSGELFFVDILTLQGDGNWRSVMEGSWLVYTEMSPVANKLMFDGLFLLPLDGGSIKTFVPGVYGTWSHDGTKVAFIESKLDDKGITEGIAEWDPSKEPPFNSLLDDNGIWSFEPQPSDDRHFAPQTISILKGRRALSWSWDGRYLAFVASRALYDSQIFRLDVSTGEVAILTTKFNDDSFYSSPAWGP